MRWILLDAGLALLALLVLGAAVRGLWQRTKGLAGAVGTAGAAIGAATDTLARAQAQAATPAALAPLLTAPAEPVRRRARR